MEEEILEEEIFEEQSVENQRLLKNLILLGQATAKVEKNEFNTIQEIQDWLWANEFHWPVT
jgi:hypothetical protein